MINSNYKHQNITFGTLKFKRINNFSIPEKYTVTLSDSHGMFDCFVTTKSDKNDFMVSITDSKSHELGACRFFVEENFIHNLSMNNFSGFKGIGSIMHLNRIATMFENNIEGIKLFSMGNAIPFHSKFKFRANISNEAELKDFMLNELFLKQHDDSIIGSVKKSASDWFSNKTQTYDSKIKLGNKILDDFIQKLLGYKQQNSKEPDIINGMDMILDRKTILDQKEVFNNLFNRYGIDYQI